MPRGKIIAKHVVVLLIANNFSSEDSGLCTGWENQRQED